MDNWDKRVQATVFIWLAFAVAVGLSSVNNPVNGNTIGLVAIAAITAFLGTLTVWLLGRDHEIPADKAKREIRSDTSDPRLALLAQLLGEDERELLKRRLVDDLRADGETLPLADLLAAQDREQRRGR
jgi:hypothetical protein